MFFVFILTLIIITLCVLLHYEVLTHLTETHFKRQLPTRMLLPFGVLVVIITHILEVMAFAVLFYYLFTLDGAGDIIGPFDYSLHDCVYFSFVNYTSLGYGDIVPVGHIRFVAGSEALMGLVLIAWTASFTYLRMQEIISKKEDK